MKADSKNVLLVMRLDRAATGTGSTRDRRSRLETCRQAAGAFLLTDAEAGPGIVDRGFLWRQFLNDYAFEDFQRTPS